MVGAAVALAHDRVNMPSDVKSPSWLAVRAVEVAGEPLWRMPMPADYATALTSATADLAHVPSGMNGAKNGQAGSIVAAMFLREFTGGRRWAHLDIVDAARAGSDDGELTKDDTGFGTRLLLRWVTQAREPQV